MGRLSAIISAPYIRSIYGLSCSFFHRKNKYGRTSLRLHLESVPSARHIRPFLLVFPPEKQERTGRPPYIILVPLHPPLDTVFFARFPTGKTRADGQASACTSKPLHPPQIRPFSPVFPPEKRERTGKPPPAPRSRFIRPHIRPFSPVFPPEKQVRTDRPSGII